MLLNSFKVTGENRVFHQFNGNDKENMDPYSEAAKEISERLNKNGSSFSASIRMLHKRFRAPVQIIYNYIRFANDIVKANSVNVQLEKCNRLKEETYQALEKGSSSNLTLHSFQEVVHEYGIGRHLIDAFLYSLEMDLTKKEFSSYDFNRYVYGSAEVVGLMCLRIFYKGDDESYNRLMYPARKLGHAFQVVNFLRDVKSDYEEHGKVYFPDVNFENFTKEDKVKIEKNVAASFYEAWFGIMHLNKEVRTGVYLSYLYSVQLLRKIRRTSLSDVKLKRHRIRKRLRIYLTVKAIVDIRFGIARMPERLKLSVDIHKKSGFCGGVVKAVKKAEELLEKHGELYCVGEIVHNEEEVRRLEAKGLVTIDAKDVPKLKGKQVLFRAHGEPPKSYKMVAEKANQLTDATCPIVLRIKDKMEIALKNGETLFLFGKKTHPETLGLVGHVDERARVVENLNELQTLDLPNSLSLFTQTTKDPVEFKKIIQYMESQGVQVKVYDTICRSVSNRKNDLQNFSKAHDIVLFVAGENSSNGKVLYKACKEANENTHFIHSPNNIVRSWFEKGQTVGVCGATSTPMWLMEEVRNIAASY